MFERRFNFKPGVHQDTRPPEAKARDYHQSELITAPAPVTWVKKTIFRSFPVRKQNGSGSCWAQATEKERGIMGFLKYGEFPVTSASFTYSQRANPQVSGTTVDDRFKYANMGSVLNSIVPDQSMTDDQMNSVKIPKYAPDMAKTLATKTIALDVNIDTIASTIEATKKGVSLVVRFGPGEWFNKEKVIMLPNSQKEWGHAIVAVDYYLNDKGEKCLRIEDSACEDGYPQREVNEAFLNDRCSYACYLLNFKTYQEVGDKPHFDGSVKSLQDCLKFEGLFPSNVDSTGTFGPVTKAALIKFQIKYNISPAVGFFGDLTKAKLLALYP